MKRFLYYNQDSVNSFLAQIEQGLLTKRSSSKEDSDSYTKEKTIGANLTGDLSAKAFGVGAELTGNLNAQNISTDVAETLIKNIQEKVLHDYAFERVYNHVINNDLISDENLRIGDIILVRETPTFLDFNYFQSLFSDDGVVKFSNDQSKKEFEQQQADLKKQYPKGTQIPVHTKLIIDKLKESVDNSEKEREELAKTIKALRNTIPYERFLMTTNMLIPLDDENFRDNPDIVAFKYGGELSIFGYVTNIVTDEETPSSNNDFASFYDTLNKTMLNMYKNQNKIYIIHPVALFY